MARLLEQRDGGGRARPLDRARVRPRDLLRARRGAWTLARVAARHGGRYISHVRSEDRDFWEAIDEILAIGREAKIPVQISHVKLAMRSLWGQAPRLLALLDEARARGDRRHRRHLPVPLLALDAHRALPRARLREPARPRSSCSPRSRRPTGCCSAATCPSRPTPARPWPRSRGCDGRDAGRDTLIELIRDAPRRCGAPGRAGRRERHRHEHDRAATSRQLLRLAAHQPLHRRRARRPPPARLRRLSAGARPLRARARRAAARGGGAPDDLARRRPRRARATAAGSRPAPSPTSCCSIRRR